jgi:hypothetical protein
MAESNKNKENKENKTTPKTVNDVPPSSSVVDTTYQYRTDEGSSFGTVKRK